MSMEAKRGLAIIASLALMAEPVVIGRVMLSSAALVLGMAASTAEAAPPRKRGNRGGGRARPARPSGGGHAARPGKSHPGGRPGVRGGSVNNVNHNRHHNTVNNVHVNVNHGGGHHGGGPGRYDHYDHHRHDRWDDDWDDHWHPVATAAAVTLTAAAIGSIVRSVPPDCSTVVVNGISYSQCGNNWYQPQYVGSSVQYVVVNPPR
ncbi:hypothetical protein E5554_16890 [Sphingobium sp. PAMC28499]|jgi:hypothetical protein|uniref:hypothetical protein n=1 Tax=Sphingobium sp. PAMC28499 TaxID=2565554 RepID=UPI00109DED23|nr:hypothetical protein [Sphingobium sp. PAMC28499]QCB39357.1 hypothetical protein E5554_16890 [Sphingobium sp. PAMC28499]